MFEVGRVCVKTAGREAGRYCVIVKKEDEGFFLVTGPKVLTKVRRRKCNMDHLEPVDMVLKVSAGAGDEAVLKAFSDEQIKKLELRKPTVAEIKAWEAQRSDKEKKREEREKRDAEKKAKEEPKKEKEKKTQTKSESKATSAPKAEKK